MPSSQDTIGAWIVWLYELLRDNDQKALFILLLIEEAGVPLPVPGDIVIMFAGYQASTGRIGLVEAGLTATLAVLMGSAILYTLSRRFGHALLFRYGRLIHLDQRQLDRVESWIRERGAIMVLAGRLTPGLRTPTSIMAGMFEIPYHQFAVYTSLAALGWSGFWLALGYFFGNSLIPVVERLHPPAYVLVATIALAAAIAGVYWWRRRRSS